MMGVVGLSSNDNCTELFGIQEAESFAVRQSKRFLARSCEAGRAIQSVPQARCLKEKRERHCRPTARAPPSLLY
jgi:hypothetical protein